MSDLFPDEDYGFKLRLDRSQPEAFFGPTAEHESILAERRAWLDQGLDPYVVCAADGAAALDETIQLAALWRSMDAGALARLHSISDPRVRCAELGRWWEPDYILLRPDPAGRYRLVAAVVCFPSSWDVREKLGLAVEEIHDVVPGLNPALADSIHTFLGRMRPGVAWLRANWGLSASGERNLHPTRPVARFDRSWEPSSVFVRIERQALVALPESNGVLFGIRLEIIPLAKFREDPAARRGLRRALETMPESMARYKNIAGVRAEIARWLAE